MEKRICLIHYTSAPGGIEVLMPEIIRGLSGERFSVFVIRPPEKGAISVYEGCNIDVSYGSLSNFTAVMALWRFVRKNRRSVFHEFNTGPFFLLVTHLAGAKKVVYSVRGTIHYSNILQKVARKMVWDLVIARGCTFLANSEYSRDVFVNFIPRVKPHIRVIYNPVYSSRIKARDENNGEGGLNICYVGRLADGKNLFRWIDAAAAIHKERGDAIFHLYGEGPLRRNLIEYSITAGMSEYLFFEGYVKDLSEIYSNADLMLFLSTHESFGNVVVESILYGTPVLVADIPSMREIFRNFPEFILPLNESLVPGIMG
ncbi:MAG: glycosyltransferase, partial [Bacteroidales bacterium]|nr:glycosyltransferase [Bacteroidales bacterium]